MTRLDMDVEDRSLDHAAGIDRRNKALAKVEGWAARHGRRLQISYTLPTTPAGLEANGIAVLRNAIENHMRVGVVNIMTSAEVQCGYSTCPRRKEHPWPPSRSSDTSGT